MAFSIRLSEQERELAAGYAELHSISLAEAFKRALFDLIEDEFDTRVGEEAMEEYMRDGKVSYPIEQLWEELGL